MGVYSPLFFADVIFLVGNGRQQDGIWAQKCIYKLKHDAYFYHILVYSTHICPYLSKFFIHFQSIESWNKGQQPSQCKYLERLVNVPLLSNLFSWKAV